MPSFLSDLSPFVTFYSYKGGVGRSMAVLNVAALLAARGFRILIIDFDLEAPGLTHLCGQGGKMVKSNSRNEGTPGVVELLADAKTKGETAALVAKPFADIASGYTFELPIPAELKPHEDGRLSIMPAGRTDSSYATRFDDLDLADLYQQGVGRGLMLHFKKVIAECGLYEYVLVDSRTGHSDEAGICTRDLADHLIVVSGFNRQNIAGTASFLGNLRAALGAEYKNHRSPDIVLSPVPIGEEDRLAEQEVKASKDFQVAWGKKLRLDLSIPYHPRLALTEDAYVTTRTTSYLKTAYSEIEDRLLDSLGHRPAYFFKSAAEAIKTGKGKSAFQAIRRALRLQKAPSRLTPRSRADAPWPYHLDFADDKQLLDHLLKLPEAGEIISYLTNALGAQYGAIQLGQQLHRRKAKEASIVDDAILSWPDFDPHSLGEYARFLHNELHDSLAGKFYEAAIKADPKSSNLRSDYGQVLLGTRRVSEGIKQLRKAWRYREVDESGNCSEIAYSLWIGSCLDESEERAWEQAFKFYLEAGIDRHPWNFDAVLARAKEALPSSVFKYAKALADAFLDESKVTALEKFPRWKRLMPLDPACVNPDGCIREV